MAEDEDEHGREEGSWGFFGVGSEAEGLEGCRIGGRTKKRSEKISISLELGKVGWRKKIKREGENEEEKGAS